MAKHIIVLSTLDTKGDEAFHLKHLIEMKGFRVTHVDTAMGGEPSMPMDVSAQEVAEAGGGNISEIRSSKKDRACNADHDEGRHPLTPFPIGKTYDRAFLDLRPRVKDLFHLTGIDVFSAGNNHILKPVHDI